VVDGADARFYGAHAAGGSPVDHGPSMSVVRQATPYVVDLLAIRSTAGGQYLDLLGAKTRKKIRRSFRHLEEIGPVSLEQAATVEEALEFLDALKGLHQAHWRARGKPGSFAKPFFERFHRKLIERGQAAGRTQLLRLRAGETVIGYLYDFVYRDHVYVYQTGFAYDSFPSVSPGYVAHVLAIERSALAGHARYDFMAGQEDYKQRMGQPMAELRWIVVQRDRLKFRLEALLRSSYHRLRSTARPVADGGEPEEASGRVRP
jgi:CelD/BcsL family acetyltransferase involved in cellulose biosynthesis